MAVPYAQLNAASYAQHVLPASTPILPISLRVGYRPQMRTLITTPRLSALPPPTASSSAESASVLAPGDLYRRRSDRRSGFYRPIVDCNTKRVSTFARPLPFRALYADVGEVTEQEVEYDPDDLKATNLTGSDKAGSMDREARIVKAAGAEERVAWMKAWLFGRGVQRADDDAGLFPPIRPIELNGVQPALPAAAVGADKENDHSPSRKDLEAGTTPAIFRMPRRQKLRLGAGIVTVILGICLLVGLIAGIAAQ